MSSRGIGQQVVHGSIYTIAASLITLLLGAARSILLARLLLPAHFGLVALALFFISLASYLRGLNPDMALISRQKAGEGFLRTYFSFRILLDLAAFILMLLAAPLLQRLYPGVPGLGAMLAVLAAAWFLSNFNHVQETLLRKNLAFSSLALIDVCSSLVMTVVAPYLAWRGWGVWALAAEQVSGLITRFTLTWGPFRQWLPRPEWNRAVVKELWQYGRQAWLAANLAFFSDQFDDFWIGTTLGTRLLGFYSKAYDLAHYPRRIVANQLVGVFTPVFARLQHDRTLLSQVFYRSAHLIIRTGFLAAGGMALVMPEFIHYVIGDKWLPMLLTFRLMLVYTMLDPVLMLVGSLFMATGRPHDLRQVRLAQALFFLPGVIAGAALAGINGVALAADGMLLVGMWRAYKPLRQSVDFSTLRLAGRPTLALAAAAGAGLWIELASPGSALEALLLKSAAFVLVFGGILLAWERDEYVKGVRIVWSKLWS